MTDDRTDAEKRQYFPIVPCYGECGDEHLKATRHTFLERRFEKTDVNIGVRWLDLPTRTYFICNDCGHERIYG